MELRPGSGPEHQLGKCVPKDGFHVDESQWDGSDFVHVRKFGPLGCPAALKGGGERFARDCCLQKRAGRIPDPLAKVLGGLENLPEDLGGKHYGEARLGKLEKYLAGAGRDCGLAIGDDLRLFGELEIAEDIHGAFKVGPGFPPIVYVKRPATRHWVWHELLHYRDYKNKGLVDYLTQKPGQSDDFVFRVLSGTKRRWAMLNQAERLDAIAYQVAIMQNSADSALPVMNREERIWYQLCKNARGKFPE